MYLYDKEEKFEEVFKSMQSKVKKGSWLDGIYKLKHKWAVKLPMVKLKGTPILQQAANVYTPPIFKLFQEEFVKSTANYIKDSLQNDSITEFTVATCSLEGKPTNGYGYKVYVHPINHTVSCSCRKFEKHGILCSHALKSLDMMNIKLIPEAYILQRWTKEARLAIVQDNKGNDIIEDPKLEKLQRYKSVCKKFARMASRVVDFDESYLLLESSLDSMSKTIEEKIKEIFKPKDSHEENLPVPQQTIDSRVASLKKREGRNSNKRPKGWVESMQDKAKKKEKK
jgi:hypothetical protein